jgi:hypothetical protein
MEPFVVRNYTGEDRPTIKGNGFDGLEIGEDREEAERFVALVNRAIAALRELDDAVRCNQSDRVLDALFAAEELLGIAP